MEWPAAVHERVKIDPMIGFPCDRGKLESHPLTSAERLFVRMQRIFLTFSDSHRMHNAGKRICKQAESLRFYDRVIGASEYDLDPDFLEKFSGQLIPGSRGFGYMCWKPQIVWQTLRMMQEGDVLHWVDAGSHLNAKGRWRLKQYFELASSCPTGVLAFLCTPPQPPLHHDQRQFPDYRESQWTKGDLLDRLNVRGNKDILASQSIGSCTFLIRKCKSSLDLVDQWRRIPAENFGYIDDSPSQSPNTSDFQEHRHDQSIFSILVKLSNAQTVSMYECWYPSKNDPNTPDWSIVSQYPVQIRRDRGVPSPSKVRWLKFKSKIRHGFTQVLGAR